MVHRNSPLVGVFAEIANADSAIEQLHTAGIEDRHIERIGKREGQHVPRAAKQGLPEERELDFTRYGLDSNEARYYEEQYEAGYTLVIVHSQNPQVTEILKQNDAYNFTAQWDSARAQEEGAVTPAMRGEDDSQSGVAITSEGEAAEQVDPAVLEADVEHAEGIFEEKYRASEEREQRQAPEQGS